MILHDETTTIRKTDPTGHAHKAAPAESAIQSNQRRAQRVSNPHGRSAQRLLPLTLYPKTMTQKFNLSDEQGLRDAAVFVNAKADALAAEAGIKIPAITETDDDVYAAAEDALSRLACATVRAKVQATADRAWKPESSSLSQAATTPVNYTTLARKAKGSR